MQTYFADTWFFIALHDRFDSHYSRANAIRMRLGRSAILTHEAVFTEMLAHFAEDGPRSRVRVASIVRDLLRSIDVVTPDRTLFLRSLARYEQRLDKQYSLVDCMSMIIMEDRGIHHVLTNDHHFTQAGFTIVNQ